MDIVCHSCKEPWDLYYLVHEEQVLSRALRVAMDDASNYMAGPLYEAAGFRFLVPAGIEEAAEGHLLILKCPACAENLPHVCNDECSAYGCTNR